MGPWAIEVAFADALLAVLAAQPVTRPLDNPYQPDLQQVLDEITRRKEEQEWQRRTASTPKGCRVALWTSAGSRPSMGRLLSLSVTWRRLSPALPTLMRWPRPSWK